MFKKSFESITKGLGRMIDDLRDLAYAKHDEAERHEELAEEHAAAHNSCVDEADRCMETAQNLANLLGLKLEEVPDYSSEQQ